MVTVRARFLTLTTRTAVAARPDWSCTMTRIVCRPLVSDLVSHRNGPHGATWSLATHWLSTVISTYQMGALVLVFRLATIRTGTSPCTVASRAGRVIATDGLSVRGRIARDLVAADRPAWLIARTLKA